MIFSLANSLLQEHTQALGTSVDTSVFIYNEFNFYKSFPDQTVQEYQSLSLKTIYECHTVWPKPSELPDTKKS